MLRRQRTVVETPQYMDTELIDTLEEVLPESVLESFFVSAVLFGTGEMRRLRRNTDVYGLVLAGYHGLQFGDDGTFTAMVASELPLDQDGLKRVEAIIDEAVRRSDPAYCAEFVGTIALDEAVVKLDVEIKRDLDAEFPDQVSWSNGSFTTCD